MTAIRVACRSCGREVDSGQVDKQIRCNVCVALARLRSGGMLATYERLWARRIHYLRSGGPHAQVEKQLGEVALRIRARLGQHVFDSQLAAETLNTALEQARQKAELRHSERIQVAR